MLGLFKSGQPFGDNWFQGLGRTGKNQKRLGHATGEKPVLKETDT